MDIQGKTVIITGAGSGIGRALAIEFGRRGANVVCVGRRADRLEQTAEVLRSQNGHAMAFSADITQRDQVHRMVAHALDRFGNIHLLFNNAGSFQSIAGVHETDPKIWWNDVTINLLGSYLCIREVLPHMLDRNSGIIINMNGGRPVGGTGYACGKAGLMELTRVLAEELRALRSKVMVFSAGPGLVRTEMTELQANTEAGRRWIPSTAESIARGKLRKPEEIAVATMKLLAIAQPEMSGLSYNPDTDFTKFGAGK